MKDKYYTPELNEFHEGFEYEMKSTFGDGTVKTQQEYNDAEWIKQTYIVGYYPYIQRIFDGKNADILPPALRVKYLDKDDIEDCGFEYDKSYESPDVFTKDTIELWLIGHSEVIIFDRGLRKDKQHVFQGTILNKSVFKQVLKMIGVEQ